MPGLDPQVAMHHLNINPDAKISQTTTMTVPSDIMEVIKSEVKKLIDSGFIREE